MTRHFINFIGLFIINSMLVSVGVGLFALIMIDVLILMVIGFLSKDEEESTEDEQ